MLDDTADGRFLANQLRLVVYPTIYRALYIPGDARFLPSTVAPVDFGDAKLWVIATPHQVETYSRICSG